MANQGERSSSIAEVQANEVIEGDEKYFFHQFLSTPVSTEIIKAQGHYIFDSNNKKYLDLHGNGVHTLGYNHPKLVEAAKNQLDASLAFSPRRFTNKQAVSLAEKLVSVSPEGLTRVLFAPGGSEAIEMAITLAKKYTKKWKTISFSGTFHGSGFQALSVGDDPHFTGDIGPLMPGSIHLSLPDYLRNPWGLTEQKAIDDKYIEAFAEAVVANPEIACFVTEPIFYNCCTMTNYYWKSIQQICKANNILIIFDEIYLAFGKSGRMFASEYSITPDIIVVGKGFGGGLLPFAGIIGKEAFNEVLKDWSIGHYTHEKSPICSAVGLALISTIQDEDLLHKSGTVAQYFWSKLLELKTDFPCISRILGEGLTIGLDLVIVGTDSDRDCNTAQKVLTHCFENGVSFKLIQGNIINLRPSITISIEEVDFIIETLRVAFNHCKN